jgi:CheY-like chemotaxis protein
MMRANATILIVEDEALVREVTAIELEDAGFRVLAAGDGHEAFSLLRNEAGIDLLFTDISLPGGIDGWTIASQARALRPDLPVIYATGYAPDALKLVPGSRFFKKPYLPATIIAAARELLAAADAAIER